MKRKLLNHKEASEYLRIASQTLYNYRYNKKGPPYIKYGKNVFYKVYDLEKFINDNKKGVQNWTPF